MSKLTAHDEQPFFRTKRGRCDLARTHQLIGHCIVLWNEVDGALSLSTLKLCGIENNEPASREILAPGGRFMSIEMRRRQISKIISNTHGNENIRQDWQAVDKQIRVAQSERNRLAHGRVIGWDAPLQVDPYWLPNHYFSMMTDLEETAKTHADLVETHKQIAKAANLAWRFYSGI